jgi:hypothetical protein
MPKYDAEETEKIAICGSMRFFEAMIGYSLHDHGKYLLPEPNRVNRFAQEKHKEKIHAANSVLVFNYGNYIGLDTQEEIRYAEWLGKKIEYLENRNCPSCGGTGGNTSIDEPPCDSCNHPSRPDVFEASNVGRSWREDSSLEKWFQFTAKELAELKEKNAKLEAIRARFVIGHIKSICATCGHTNTEDGCAFCLKAKANRAILPVVQSLENETFPAEQAVAELSTFLAALHQIQAQTKSEKE